MKKILTCVLIISLFLSVPAKAGTSFGFPNTNEKDKDSSSNSFSFIQNKGQIADFDGNVRNEFLYYVKTEKLDIYFREKGITYIFKKGDDMPRPAGLTKEDEEKVMRAFLDKKTLYYRLDLDFVNASENIKIDGFGKSDFYLNFYYAHCPEGILNIMSYDKIRYQNVYEGIDFEFYFLKGKFKYDIILESGANINDISLKFNGANQISLSNNEVKIISPVGDIIETLPKSFTISEIGEETKAEVNYQLMGNEVHFSSLTKKSEALVIDPQISWTTYYDDCFWNGLGSSIDVKGTQCLITSYGSSINFPTLDPGGSAYFVNATAGQTDYRILKFDTDGVRIWATYYGGTSWEFYPRVKIDYAGNILVAGYTESTNIPTQDAGGYYDATYDAGTTNHGAFIIKFNSSGVRQWATHYDYVSYPFVEVDLNNNVYIVGRSGKNDPPVLALAGAYNQPLVAHDGGGTSHSSDIFIVKFNSSTTRTWATNVGGSTDEFPQDLKCGSDNFLNILALSDCYYGTGLVTQFAGGSSYFDNTTGPSASNRDDLLLYRFNTSNLMVWGTAFGGTANDNGQQGRITTDNSNNIYIYAETSNATIPFTDPGGGAYYDNTFQSGGSGFNPFIARFTSAGVLTWCTFFGSYGLGFGMNFSNYIGVNNNNNLILLTTDGGGVGGTFPLVPRAGDYNATLNVYMGVYIAEFASNMSVAWSTYYAGSPTDRNTLGDASLSSNSCGYELYMTTRWEMYDAAAIDPPWVKPLPTSYQDNTFLTTGNESGLVTRFSILPSVAPTGINAAPPTICPGDATTLTVVGGSLGSGANWVWYAGGCGGTPIGTGVSISVSPGTTTVYYIRAEGTCNTTSCASVTVTVSTNSTVPSAINATINPICAGNSTTLSVSGGSLGSGAIWHWYSGSCGGISEGTGPTLIVSPGGPTTYYVRAEGTCDTTSCVSVIINVNTNSTAAASLSTTANPICQGDSTSLNIVGGSLGSGASWIWYSGICGGTYEGTGTTLNVYPAVNTTYFALAQGTCNTTTCASLTINVTDVAASAGTDQTICLGDSATLTATGNGSFLWSYLGLTTASITVGPSGTTSYIVTVTNGSCTGSDTVVVNVTTAADATITSVGPYCTGQGAFTLTAVNPGGTWSGPGITNGTTGLFDPPTAGVGIHQIIYSISGSCGDTDTAFITVTNSLDATITAAGPFCYSDAPVNLSSADPGGTWSGSGITNTTSGTFDPGTAGVGTHLITYVISGLCGDTGTISITVDSLFDASIISTGPYCDNAAPVNLIPTTTGGTWTGNGIINATTGQFSPATAGAGIQTIIYTITGNCGNSDTASILVNQAPSALGSGTDETCMGANDGTAGIIGSSGTPPYSYLWETSETTASISGLAPDNYTVIVSDANGCFTVDTVQIKGSSTPCETITPVIYVPNIFSPNGDGYNDILLVRGQGIASLELKIYDRWGEMVFETTDLNYGWDGTFRGKPMGNAVFVYYIKAEFINEEKYDNKGNVTLIR